MAHAPARDLILGTAGHIDHGKTSLVRALTGVDCDRLPEEKARGITIDLGFARLDLGDVRLGVVDVPGHERFVKNMLSGATGFDIALLVVAADDSVMPQTREHFEILRLLGVRRGVIALTKVDVVDDTTREVVELEVRELVRGSFLEAAPTVATSAVTGRGIEDLKAALRTAAATVGGGPSPDRFRLPIDRAFVVQGHGTVVTGSVASGRAAVGDELEWHKGDGTTAPVRVRSLNNHGRPADEVHVGQRAAVNLPGVPLDAVRRGQELAAPGYLVPSRLLTVRLRALAGGRPIRHRLPVRLHAGTAEVMATVSVLDAAVVEPGDSGLAQLHLAEPVTTVCGEPFVVRDSSAEHTLGGGTVLQPTAARIRRSQLESIERAARLDDADPAVRAETAAWFTGTQGIDPSDLPREAGLASSEAARVVDQLVAAGTLVAVNETGDRKFAHAARIADLDAQILKAVGELHAANPLATNHERAKVLARLPFVGNDALIQRAIDRLLASRVLTGDTRRVARADFKPKLSANQRKLKDRIVEEHRAARFQPPDPAGYLNHVGGSAAALGEIFEVACAEGHLVKVSNDLYLSADSDREIRHRVRGRLTTDPGATVAEIRDLLGTTRKYAVPLCEYLDRIGLTKRDGDRRWLVETQPAPTPGG